MDAFYMWTCNHLRSETHLLTRQRMVDSAFADNNALLFSLYEFPVCRSTNECMRGNAHAHQSVLIAKAIEWVTYLYIVSFFILRIHPHFHIWMYIKPDEFIKVYFFTTCVINLNPLIISIDVTLGVKSLNSVSNVVYRIVPRHSYYVSQGCELHL